MAVIFLNDQAGANLVNYISDELDAIALLPEEERRAIAVEPSEVASGISANIGDMRTFFSSRKF